MSNGIDNPPIRNEHDVRLAWKFVNSNMYHGALQDQFGEDCWEVLERVRDKIEYAAIEYGIDLHGVL